MAATGNRDVIMTANSWYRGLYTIYMRILYLQEPCAMTKTVIDRLHDIVYCQDGIDYYSRQYWDHNADVGYKDLSLLQADKFTLCFSFT